MPMFVGPEIDSSALDRAPFQFSHGLIDHPAVSLSTLAKVLPELPSDQVMYSRKLEDRGVNMDTAHLEYTNGLSIEETIENIRTSNSYIAVRKPEVHPEFKDLARVVTRDIGEVMRRQGTGSEPTDVEMWLFIASPGAITPFHFDRFSNYLLQFRGSKKIAIFKPWNEEVFESSAYESRMAGEDRRMEWHDDKDRFAHKFVVSPGEGVHIPFLGGHYVENGPGDASITLSVFFHNDETTRWKKALLTNHILRKRLGPLGFTPRPVNTTPSMDAMKARAYPLAKFAHRGLRLVEKTLGGGRKPA
jgi:Cupin-like domain